MNDSNQKSEGTIRKEVEDMYRGWCGADAQRRREWISRFRLEDLLDGTYPAASRYFRLFSAVERGQPYDFENDSELPKCPGPASKLEAEELVRFEDGLASGAHAGKSPYSLKEIRIELFRRKLGGIDGLNVVRQICRLCRKKYRSKITHAELFRALWPRQPYDGRTAGSRIMLALDAAMLFCIENELPPMNILVVNRMDRGLTRHDIKMTYETAKYLGADVGSTPAEYVAGEMAIAEDIRWSGKD